MKVIWCYLCWNIKICLTASLLLFGHQPLRAMDLDDLILKTPITNKEGPGFYEDLMKPQMIPQIGTIRPIKVIHNVITSNLFLYFTVDGSFQRKKAMLKLECNNDEFEIGFRQSNVFIALKRYKTPVDTDDLFNYLHAWHLIDVKRYDDAMEILKKLSTSNQLVSSLKEEAETYFYLLKDPNFMKEWEPDSSEF